MVSKKTIIVILIATLGYVNLFVGAWSFIAIDSLNLPSKLSNLSSQLDSFDTSLVKTAELQEPISILKQSAIEELNFFENYSEMLNLIPIYFIAIGALLFIIALVAYYIIPDVKNLKKKSKPENDKN
jgi:hypothetical protein